MKALLLILAITLTATAQIKPPKELQEIKALQVEFIKATNEYKESLAKLLAIYEGNVKREEDKLRYSESLLSDGLIAKTQVEESQRRVAASKEKIERVKQDIIKADQQIASLPSDEELLKRLREEQAARRKTKPSKRCPNWTLTAHQRVTANSVTFGYRFVCQN